MFSVDFNSESILGKQDQRNKMLRHLIDDFYKIDLSDADEDIIGNSYMYLIERFGADAGKKAGEFFTVKSVAKQSQCLHNQNLEIEYAIQLWGAAVFCCSPVKKSKSKDLPTTHSMVRNLQVVHSSWHE